MRDICQRMSSATPSATHGWKSVATNCHGRESSAEAGIPRFIKKSPKALLSTTTVTQIHVFKRRREASAVIGAVSLHHRDTEKKQQDTENFRTASSVP